VLMHDTRPIERSAALAATKPEELQHEPVYL
jgi:hypothetical protein